MLLTDREPKREPMPRHTELKALTPGQLAFVGAYLISPCAVQAYRTAFPGTRYASAAVQSHRLLKQPNIREEIAAARRAQSKRTQITADKVLREIARVAFSDVFDLLDENGEFLHPRNIPFDTRQAIAAVKVSRERTTRRVTRNGETETTTTTVESVIEYKLFNKLEALGKLFNHLGLSTAITPLESLLANLPREIATQLRTALFPEGHGPLRSRQA